MTQAKPFIKWVGGKGQLLGQLEHYYPRELASGRVDNYVEPFLGGGAMFFAISGKYKIKSACLSDLNKDLVLTYLVIQQKPECLLDYLKQYQDEYDGTKENRRGELFLDMRRHFNAQRFEINYNKWSDNWMPRAAQFIFLNKTCFNGLFRLNAKGEFNVPYGKYKTATICDEHNILTVSNALKNATILRANYKDTYSRIDDRTFVYFDPPYRPVSRTANFTTYTGAVFGDTQQRELANFFHQVDKEKGAKLMLSNSDPTNMHPDDDFFIKAYSGYNIFKLSANRAVNCKGNGRGKISELLITNYKQGYTYGVL